MKMSPAGNGTSAEACPQCGGVGFYIDHESNTSVRCNCGRSDTLAYQERLRESGVPRRFLEKELNDFQAKDRERRDLLKAAQAYSLGFQPGEDGLMMRGVPGSGKTHLAVAVMKQIMRRGFTAHYFNFSDLLTRIRDTWSDRGGPTEEEILAPVDHADLLVLDDVGAEHTADWVRDRLYLIVNRRYEGGKALIITTNCSEEELERRIGPRTISRLYEMCAGHFPPFPRVDWRRKNLV